MNNLAARQHSHSSSTDAAASSGMAATSAAASAAASYAGKSATAAAASAATSAAKTTNTNHGSGHGGTSTIQMAVNYTWYLIAGFTFACAVLYAYNLITAWYIRRRTIRARKAGNIINRDHEGKSKVSRIPTAVSVIISNFSYLRVFPLWIYSSSTAAEWWWTTAYTGLTLGLGFYGSISNGKLDYANPMGYVAFGQIPIIIGLASRNNVLSYITGISYEKFNYLHRASGRVAVLTTWLHTLGWFHKGLGTKHGPGTVLFASGMWGAVAVLVLYLTSFAVARRFMYEAFLVIHIAMALIFVVASYYHWPPLAYWCWVGLFLWGLDRFVGLFRLVVINKAWLLPFKSKYEQHSSCTVELVDPEVVRLTVKRPLLRWNPGQHAYITMPSVANLRYEQHPMTIANVQDDSGDVVFIMRAQTGFTRKLVNKLQSDVTTDIPCYLEGPYGISHDLNHYDSVLLVAGGTGVTFALSHLLSIIQSAQKGTSAVSHVRFVWNVRSADHVAWIAPLLNAALAKGSGGLKINIDVYVTRTSASSEPGQTTGLSAGSVGEAALEGADYSPSGSSENVDEKTSTSSSSDVDEKRTARAGLSPDSAPVVSFHNGRSELESIVRADIKSCAGVAGGMGVGVCGPNTLTQDARRAVMKVNTASAILRGQDAITFYSETFGW